MAHPHIEVVFGLIDAVDLGFISIDICLLSEYYPIMGQIIQQILDLIERGEVRISAHGYDELAHDDILIKDVMAGVSDAVVVEDYPEYPKGPCALALQRDQQGKPIHVVWGIPKNASSPAVLVTAYRPDPDQWSTDFMRRKR